LTARFAIFARHRAPALRCRRTLHYPAIKQRRSFTTVLIFTPPIRASGPCTMPIVLLYFTERAQLSRLHASSSPLRIDVLDMHDIFYFINEPLRLAELFLMLIPFATCLWPPSCIVSVSEYRRRFITGIEFYYLIPLFSLPISQYRNVPAAYLLYCFILQCRLY